MWSMQLQRYVFQIHSMAREVPQNIMCVLRLSLCCSGILDFYLCYIVSSTLRIQLRDITYLIPCNVFVQVFFSKGRLPLPAPRCSPSSSAQSTELVLLNGHRDAPNAPSIHQKSLHMRELCRFDPNARPLEPSHEGCDANRCGFVWVLSVLVGMV